MREDHLDRRQVIPKGHVVICDKPDPEGNPIRFTTVKTLVLEPGATSDQVIALHADYHEGIAIGDANGQPDQTLFIPNAPIIADSGFSDIIIGETLPADFNAQASSEETMVKGVGIAHGVSAIA